MPEPTHHQGRHIATLRMTPKLYRFLTQRRYADRVTVQQVLTAGVVAYVMGDLEITPTGYAVPRARDDEDPVAVISRADGEDEVFTLEDAELSRELRDHVWKRPKALHAGDQPWGTFELAQHLKKVTGRYISRDGLRRFLAAYFPRAEGEARWEWTGADDPQIQEIVDQLELVGSIWNVPEADLRKAGAPPRREVRKVRKKHEDHRRKREHQSRRDAERRARETP